LTTDGQKEITDTRKSVDLCGATDSAEDTKLDEGASEIGNDLQEQNLQVFLLPDDIVRVAFDVKLNCNFSTKFKTKVKLNRQFQKLRVM
jgi:hypothetical protein